MNNRPKLFSKNQNAQQSPAVHMTPKDFIANYNGPPVFITAAGCGSKFAELLSMPGASKVVEMIQFPYSKRLVMGVAGHEEDCCGLKCVSDMYAAEFIQNNLVDEVLECPMLVVTGALTTDRYRQGDNEAYFGIYNPATAAEEKPFSIYHLKLDKKSQADYQKLTPDEIQKIREFEDFLIVSAGLNLLMGNIQKGLVECFPPEPEMIEDVD